MGVYFEMDKIVFYFYFYVKDLVGWVVFVIFFFIWIFYVFNVLGYFDNYIFVNLMFILFYIVLEWYFLLIYVIFCSIFDKVGGVVVIVLVFICFLVLFFFKSMYVCSLSF